MTENLQGERGGGISFSLPKNIGFGLIWFGLVAASIGLGLFISIVTADNLEDTIFALLGLFGALFIMPVVSLLVGLLVGKLARNEWEALAAGAVTGVAGFFIYLLILFGLVSLAFAAHYPSSQGYDYNDGWEESRDVGQALTEFGAVVVPNGLIGGLAAFLIHYFIYRDPKTGAGWQRRKRALATTSPNQPSPPPGSAPPSPDPEGAPSTTCLKCGLVASYIKEYERHYCYSCQAYV